MSIADTIRRLGEGETRIELENRADGYLDLLRRIRDDIEARADMRLATAVDLSDGLYAELCRVLAGGE